MADDNNSPLIHPNIISTNDNVTPISSGNTHQDLIDNISCCRLTDTDSGCREKFSKRLNCSESLHWCNAEDEIDKESVESSNDYDTSSTFHTETNIKSVITEETCPLTFEINITDSTTVSSAVPKVSQFNLQEAFLQFRKKKQDELQLEKQRNKAIEEANVKPARLEELRHKIISQAMKYFGVPYAKKYWAPNTQEHQSPIFLDCCGLVRQVIRDLQQDIGFRLGPWNQAYMYDTLPITLTKEQMKPGDLVFMTGIYVNPKSKKQLHNMVHVEIWLGCGDKTIGSRWNNGKVQVFDSYMFSPKSFHSEQYIFKSVDTWLMGVCHSHCSEHAWRMKKHGLSSKSIFNVEGVAPDDKTEINSDEDIRDEEAFIDKEDMCPDADHSIQTSSSVKTDECSNSDTNIQSYRDVKEDDKCPDAHTSIQFSCTTKEDYKCANADSSILFYSSVKEDDQCPNADTSIQYSNTTEKDDQFPDADTSIQYSNTTKEDEQCPDADYLSSCTTKEEKCQDGENSIKSCNNVEKEKCPEAKYSIKYSNNVKKENCPDVKNGIPSSNNVEKGEDLQEDFSSVGLATRNTILVRDIKLKNNISVERTGQKVTGSNRWRFTQKSKKAPHKRRTGRTFRKEAKASRYTKKTDNYKVRDRLICGNKKVFESVRTHCQDAHIAKFISGSRFLEKFQTCPGLKNAILLGLVKKGKLQYPPMNDGYVVKSRDSSCDEEMFEHATAKLPIQEEVVSSNCLETSMERGKEFNKIQVNDGIQVNQKALGLNHFPQVCPLSAITCTNPHLSQAKSWPNLVNCVDSVVSRGRSCGTLINPMSFDTWEHITDSCLSKRYDKENLHTNNEHEGNTAQNCDSNDMPALNSCFLSKSSSQLHSEGTRCEDSLMRQSLTVISRSIVSISSSLCQEGNTCELMKEMNGVHMSYSREAPNAVASNHTCSKEASKSSHPPGTLVAENEQSATGTKDTFQLLGGGDTPEIRKSLNTSEREAEPYVGMTLTSCKNWKVSESFDELGALGYIQDVLKAVQMKNDSEEDFTDITNTSLTSDISVNEFLSLEDTKSPHGEVSITRIPEVINKVIIDKWDELEIPDTFISDVEIMFLNAHQFSPDKYGSQRNLLETPQILHFSESAEYIASDNVNNNSSNDWQSEVADSCKTDNDENHEMISQSDLQRNSMLQPLNLYKQISQGTSESSKERTMQAESISKTPSFWLRDKDNETSSLVSSLCEKVTLHSPGAREETVSKMGHPNKQRPGRSIWSQKPKRQDEIPLTPDEVCRDTEDSDTRVARYVLNQWPKGDDSGGSQSAFQSYLKYCSPVSSFDSNHESLSAAVTEDTMRRVNGNWSSQNKNEEQDRDNIKELYGTKTKTKKSDATYNPTVPETLSHRVNEQGIEEAEFTALCSIDNLNEFTERVHGGRKYFIQDTTSNDGDDIDGSLSDESDDDLKYYDPEKQAAKEMMEVHIGLRDDEEDYDYFCESMHEISDLSRRSSLLDLQNNLFPGDDELSRSIKIPDDNTVEEKEGTQTEWREGDADDISKENATEKGGGDANKEDSKIRGDDRKGGKQSKLPHCCLPGSVPPTFFVGGANGSALVEGPLLALGWKKIIDKFDERYKLKWVENKSKINYLAFREGEQLVNHIPNCGLLTNKLGLLCSLQDYERMTLLTKGRLPRMKMADFVPETYKLDDKADRDKFLQQYQDGETWICKPTSMNQGKGIFLLRSRQTVNQLCDRDNKPKNIPRFPMMRIVQRYIDQPLLLEGRKFDIRSYMFIASTIPFLVLYHKGYARLSCHKYRPEDPNLTTHLTNQFVQKKDPSYKDVKEDTAWTMDKLNDYINKYVAPEKGLEKDWVYGTLTKQMQKITLHCFNSVKHKLQSRMGYFDLYGMDFMVDCDMKVWLIEINANPALHTNCQALKDAIPSVIEDALYLAIECFEKSCKGEPLMPLNSLGGYSVLYCGSSPNAVTHRQIRSVSPFKDITIWSRPSGVNIPRHPYLKSRKSTCCFPKIGHLSSVPNNRLQSSPHNITRDRASQPSSNQASSTIQVPIKRLNRTLLSSTLPAINIGLTAGLKNCTDSGNTNTSKHTVQNQKLRSSQTQPPQQPQQPNKRILLTPVLSSEEKKCFIKRSAPGVGKSDDKLHRGN